MSAYPSLLSELFQCQSTPNHDVRTSENPPHDANRSHDDNHPELRTSVNPPHDADHGHNDNNYELHTSEKTPCNEDRSHHKCSHDHDHHSTTDCHDHYHGQYGDHNSRNNNHPNDCDN